MYPHLLLITLQLMFVVTFALYMEAGPVLHDLLHLDMYMYIHKGDCYSVLVC